jgi:hypothetical protein
MFDTNRMPRGRRRPRLAGLTLILLAASTGSGCIEHSVRIDAPSGGLPAGARIVVGTHPLAGTLPSTTTNVLPLELPISSWALTRQGLERYDVVARSPLVWWQRFPCDIVTDLALHRFRASTEITLAYRLVTPQDATSPDALAQAALAHGYAHQHQPHPPHP